MNRSTTGAPSTAGAASGGVLELTPHKIGVCHLIHLFAPPAQHSVSFPFQSVAHHNRFGLFLLSFTRSCEDFLDPTLDELLNQLKIVGESANDWLRENLLTSLSALSSPDDLFNFFDKLRGVLVAPEGSAVEDDHIFLDPNSHLGIFLRCCILSFNMLSFEGVCHLSTNLAAYCNSADSTYELAEDDNLSHGSEFHESLEDADLDYESAGLHNYEHQLESLNQAGESSSIHVRASKLPYGHIDDIQAPNDSKVKHNALSTQINVDFVPAFSNKFGCEDSLGILRSRWQVEGYLNMQADLLEKDASSFPLDSFAATLKQLEKLAPDLHRVQYLQYLNALYHDDYIVALDNLHSYFDYSAGMEGPFSQSSSPPPDIFLGRYETALLCLGTLQSRFGNSKRAMEALTEAVRVSQQNNDDSCLAYTLAAICSLLSEIGASSMPGIIGSPYPLGATSGLGTPLSTQQQLLVLLKRSLTRADHLKLASLLAYNHLALARFDLKHVKRPLVSFGPKTSIRLRTCPISICTELRLSSHVLSDFGANGLSLLNDTGAFSTSWLKNLAAANEPWLQKSEKSRNLSANDYDVFHFNAQPNPLPASVLQLAGASYLLRATSWEHYGSAPVVQINALVYATCFADAASSSELSLAYIKLIQHLAVFKGYTEALDALKLAEEKFFSVSKSRIQFLKLQLLHERALHRGHLKAAQQICDQFGVLASSADGVDMELKTEARIRHARTLLAAKQFSQAAAVASNVFCTCYKFNMQVENATILLLLSEIHKKAGNAVLGLHYTLASLSFCKTFNLDLLEASATLTLAELWLSLGSSHAKRASNLINRALPMILGHGGLELCARANITVAKCLLSDPRYLVSEDPNAVLDPLNEAAEKLEILEYHEVAAEAFYLIAIIYDNLGRLDDRELAAASFRKHVLALDNSQDEDDFTFAAF